MHDTVLAAPPALNRRFVRLQAVLNLYAYYVCKRANYDWALDQIHDHFIPDLFADPLIDKMQLAQEAQQARALFASHLTRPSISIDVVDSPSSRVRASVTRALAQYKRALAQDMHRLEGGMKETVTKINQACVRIWQLLVEWTYIAKQQNERPKLSQRYATVASVTLAHSQVLQRLQNDSILAKLVQQEAAGWEDHSSLVEGWYNQFVKPCAAVQQYLIHPMTPYQDQQLLVFLLENIIFKTLSIQAFFSDIDLKWFLHKRIVSKQVHRGLANFTQEGRDIASLQVFDLVIHGKQEQYFYIELVRRTLQQDTALEQLIAEKAKNWSVDRIMLLDKTIMKLALCEMLHFDDIPMKVSINEYIELSKIYSMPKSSQFVNGLLDAVAATLRRESSNKT